MKSIHVEQYFDCSQREIVVDIAAAIYKTHGCDITNKPLGYLFESSHPTERAVLCAAEEIFAFFWGDAPDYSDEEEEAIARSSERAGGER